MLCKLPLKKIGNFHEQSRKIQNKVFVVVGDGEINEGTFWESLLIASNKNLNNLCCIVDYNRSNDLSIKLDPLKHKLDSFGFTVLEIDGHCHEEIRNATMFFRKISQKPTIVLANTIKGKVPSAAENVPVLKKYLFHGVFPTNVGAIDLSYDSADSIEEFTVDLQVQWWDAFDENDTGILDTETDTAVTIDIAN